MNKCAILFNNFAKITINSLFTKKILKLFHFFLVYFILLA